MRENPLRRPILRPLLYGGMQKVNKELLAHGDGECVHRMGVVLSVGVWLVFVWQG